MCRLCWACRSRAIVKKGTLTISQEDYIKSILARFGMENCKPSSIPGTGSELSTEQPAETLLNTEQTQRYQAITGSVMYLAQITRYDVMYAVCQLARAMSKPSKAHMGAAKQLLRYLAGTTDFSIVYKRGGFKLSAFSDANWGNNPDNGKSTSAYIVMLSKAPISFKSGIQSLTAMSTMEAELVASALTMKEAVFCSNMMTELGFGQPFGASAAIHRQNRHPPRPQESSIQFPNETHCFTVLLRSRASDGRSNLHPLHPYGPSARGHRDQVPEQASSSFPHRKYQEIWGVSSITPSA